ncbi:MAG: HyaD/HybD family hydrogenase maturation endopeptidase [bacterium]
MKKEETGKKIMILGVGNVLLGDEGIGVHIATHLKEFPLPDHIEVIEGGTDGFKLFHLILDTDRLIVVDCVKGGGEPASLYRFDIDEYTHFPDTYKTSVHQISIDEVVTLSGAVGDSPETTFIGVEPSEIFMSMELSLEIEEKLPRILELVLETAGLDPAEYSEYLKGPFVKPGPPQYADS